MKQFYDEKEEKRLNEFLGIAYKNSFDFTYPKNLLEKLLDYYNESHYPGVYYRIATLYEMGAFRKFDTDKSIEYFKKAAEEGYLLAMNRLAEIGLNELKLNQFQHAKWASKSVEEYDDAYGKYLLSKYHLLYGVLNNEKHLKRGIELMKESAKQGCWEAQTHLNDFRDLCYFL